MLLPCPFEVRDHTQHVGRGCFGCMLIATRSMEIADASGTESPEFCNKAEAWMHQMQMCVRTEIVDRDSSQNSAALPSEHPVLLAQIYVLP